MKKKVLLGLVLLTIIGTGAVFAQNRTTAETKSRYPQDFYRVPSGTYSIGRIGGRAADGPYTQPRQVQLRPFYIAKYEVTLWEWQRVMTGGNPNAERPQYWPVFTSHGELPVNGVNWWGAISYCNARSRMDGLTPVYRIIQTRTKSNSIRWQVEWNKQANGWRLPTDAEWEVACRAGTTTKYHYGNTLSTSQARISANGPTRVGQYPPNAWGLYDMHGNVWEWCWDWFDYFDDGATIPRPRNLGVMVDPSGPAIEPGADLNWLTEIGAFSDFRVVRGGSWTENVNLCASYERMRVESHYIGHSAGDITPVYATFRLVDGVIGFRIARNAQ